MDPTAQQDQAPLSSSDVSQAPPVAIGTQQKNDASDQVRKLGEKVEKTPLPADLKETLLDRVSRLGLLRTSAGYLNPTYIIEYESTASYINWIVGLPWSQNSKEVLDLNLAYQTLNAYHYGLPTIKDYILNYLSVLILKAKKAQGEGISRAMVDKAPILCLVGLAGTGKTTLAASIAKSLNRQFERIPLGGMGDARALRGQSRSFADAEPGYIIKKLVHCKTKNPVILLDELDRVSDEARADIMGVLVELLDPEQNRAFTDHYIDYPFDLSQVLFVTTTNNTTNISTAVLDRLEIIQMPSYTDEEKMVIGKKYLLPKIRIETGISENQLIIDDAIWPSLIRPLGYDSGIRSLYRTITDMSRKAARLLVEGKTQIVHINAQNVHEFLPTW